MAVGEQAEAVAADVLHIAYPDCTFIKANKKSRYLDLLCTEHGEAVEVKTDRKAAETGNLCFEANLFIHSKAERVFYIVGEKAYCWNMEALKMQLLVLHAQGKTRGLMGGDGWKNALILAKLEDITIGAMEYELTKKEDK